MLLRKFMLFSLIFCFWVNIGLSQDKKPEVKKIEAKKPDDKKPGVKKSEDKKPDDNKTEAKKLDDKNPETKEAGAVAAFNKEYDQWKKMVVELHNIADRHAAAKEEEKKKNEDEFKALLKKGKSRLVELTTLAEKAAAELTDETKDHIKFLISRMAELVQEGNYKETIRLAEVLIKQKIKKDEVSYMAALAAFRMDDYQKCVAYLEGLRVDKDDPIPFTYQARYKEAKQRIREKRDDKLPRVKLTTSKGDVIIELFENEAPNTVANFISLVEKKYYDGLTFHRVLEGFMAQAGDPKGDGSGGPGYRIKDEVNRENFRHHYRGVLSMAKTKAPDTGGSQFYITFTNTSHLDGIHTVFGRVIKGMDVVNKLTRIDPDHLNDAIKPDKIIKATVQRKDKKKKYKPETIPE